MLYPSSHDDEEEGAVQSSHEPTFGALTVFYTYSFDIGRENHHKFIRRILKAGLAETAVSASTGDILLSPRYRELLKLRDRALSIQQIEEFFHGARDFRSLKLGSVLLLGVIAVRQLPRILFRRAKITSQTSDAQTEVGDKASDGSIGKSTAEFIENAVVYAKVVAGLQHAVDRDLYRPGYLTQNPYYRLHLRSPRFRARLGETYLHNSPVSIDTTLLVHSSGVALLTFVVGYPTGIDRRQIGLLNRSDLVSIANLDLSESVAVGYAKASGVRPRDLTGDWAEELEAGERRILLKSDEEVTISDLYNIYAAALGRHHGESISSEWMCFTTVIALAGRCCPSRNQWIDKHETDLGPVLSRVAGPVTRTQVGEYNLLDDFSIREKAALYISSGFVLEIVWTSSGEDAPDTVDWLMRTTVIENGLLQYWQLKILDALPQDGNLERRSTELQQRLIFGLVEHGQSALRYGSAGDIANAVVDRLGGKALRTRVTERAELLRELVAGEQAKQAAAGTTRLATAALLAAVIFALPAIREGIEIFNTAGRGLPSTSVNADALAVNIYCTLIGCALIVAVLTLPKRLRGGPRKGRTKRIGMRWPGEPFTVRLKRKRDQ